MHSYATDFRHTSYIHLGLAVIAFGLYEALKLVPLPTLVSLHPAVTLTIFGAIELLFNQWGWRVLCLIAPLRVYDFGGAYEGRIRSGDGAEFAARLTIRQTWSRIAIDFESGDATSKSFSASIVHDRLAKGTVEVVYNYFAPGTHTGEERVGAHYGTTMLKRIGRGTKLKGDYFTEQKRDSFGHIVLSRS